MNASFRRVTSVMVFMMAGCVALDHTNPLDVNAEVTVEVTATRDTLTALGQSVTFTATAGPEFPNAPIKWVPALGKFTGQPLAPEGTGPTYTLIWSAQSEMPSEITAWVGPHSRTKTITYSQRFGGIRFTACATSCSVNVNSPGANSTLFYQPVDSLGRALVGLHSTTPSALEIASGVISRNPAIVSVVQQSVYSGYYVNTTSGGQTGSTWIVFVKNQFKDSIEVSSR